MNNSEPTGAGGTGERPVLVNIRCARHGTILASVTSAPADWSASLDVPLCPRCAPPVPPPERHDYVVVMRWASGKGVGFPSHGEVPWEDLRESIDAAYASGKQSDDFRVRFVDGTDPDDNQPRYPR